MAHPEPGEPDPKEGYADDLAEAYRGPFAFAARRAGLVLAFIALLTVAALLVLVDPAQGRLRLSIDPGLSSLSTRSSEELAFAEAVQRRFGLGDTVIVMVEAPDVFAAGVLSRIDALSHELEAHPDVASVQSLTTVALPRSQDGNLRVQKLRREEWTNPEVIADLRKLSSTNPLLADQLVARTMDATALVVHLEPPSVRQLPAFGLADWISARATAASAPGFKTRVTGALVVRAAMSHTIYRQLRWALPVVILVLAGVLLWAFRSAQAVVLPVVTILLVLVWTFAIVALIGRPLNLVTSLAPPLLLTMGLAYGAHVMSEYEALRRSHPDVSHRDRILLLLAEVAAPIFLTGGTTAISLLALLLNALPAIREFAWISAVGVAITVLLVLTFLPAALTLWPRRPATRPLPGEHLFEAISSGIGNIDVRHRRGVLTAGFVVGVIALLFALRVQPGDAFVGVFSPDHPVRVDYEAVGKRLGGVAPLLIVIESQEDDGVIRPDVLVALDKLEDWLARQQPDVGSVLGLVDHLRVLDGLIGRDSKTLPTDPVLVQQLLFFGDGDNLRGAINPSHSATLIAVRLRADDTASISALLARLQPQLDQLPRSVTARVTGESVDLAHSVDAATQGQLASIALSLGLIWLCLAIQFWSIRVGFLAMLPTLLQTALYFGALGIAGVHLNATTGLVECLVLGLAVDDTIHYLARFDAAARKSASESKAAVSALAAVIRPATLTKGMLAAGFLTLVVGPLQNQAVFGWLAAFTLLAAWLVDLFVTPAFMSGLRIVTIWDSLRLNLGRDVQQTIPLFAGLSDRQARVFALLSRLESVPPGTRIFTEGEEAGDMTPGDPAGDACVIVDGHCVVWTMRDGERIELSRPGRGTVLGEAGYFGQARTATVDAVTHVRLMRFDDADQEQILRRYPAIMARVLLNLNRIQAQRRVQDRAML